MSRVYDALKRAERQRSEGQAQNGVQSTPVSDVKLPNRAAVPAETIADSPPESAVPPDSQAEVSDSTTALPANGRGPRLVVGRPEYSPAAEQFHLLSLIMGNWAAEKGQRVFAITSALSGEGKSFVTLNLGASLATLGNWVILIDADLRVPALHHSLRVNQTKGLAEYLMGTADFTECIHSASLPNLFLVPAGRTNISPAELLAGSRMRQFVEQVRARVPDALVIIDSPAAAVVPEPQILGRLVDGVLLVVAANRTPRGLVKRTLDATEGATVCGVVLNRFEPPHSTVSYYPERYAEARQ